MKIDLKAIGLTQAELRQLVVEAICSRLLDERYFDGDEETVRFGGTQFNAHLHKVIQERIDQQIKKLADKHVLPNVTEFIKNLELQETTKWGDKIGKPVTFIEYLVARAEKYMTEEVNYEGKAKSERDGYSWTGTQTRITYLVHQHLHYSIETAMKEALKITNNSVTKGIEETVKLKLEELSKQLKVSVSNGR